MVKNGTLKGRWLGRKLVLLSKRCRTGSPAPAKWRHFVGSTGMSLHNYTQQLRDSESQTPEMQM